MTIRQDLLADIHAAMQALNSLNLNSTSAANDIYEAYVFALAIQAAEREGATVTYENIFGLPTADIVFRSAPGHIFPSKPPSTQVPYTHAVISIPDKAPLELHQGIYVSGKSGLLHESDVAMV